MKWVFVMFPRDVIPLLGEGMRVLLWERIYYFKKGVETLVSNRRIILCSLYQSVAFICPLTNLGKVRFDVWKSHAGRQTSIKILFQKQFFVTSCKCTHLLTFSHIYTTSCSQRDRSFVLAQFVGNSATRASVRPWGALWCWGGGVVKGAAGALEAWTAQQASSQSRE